MEPSSVATAPQMADIKDETPVIKTVKVDESADNLIDDYSVWLNHNREKCQPVLIFLSAVTKGRIN